MANRTVLFAPASTVSEGGRFASVLNLVTIVLSVEVAEKTVVLGISVTRDYSHIG